MSILRTPLQRRSPAPVSASPAPPPMAGCLFCEKAGGRLLQNHESFRIIAADDHELPGVARVVWNHHVQEVSDLEESDRGLLMQAIYEAELQIRTLMRPHKVNVASFGNQVPHLHVHVIPRWRTDPWWPESTWSERPALVWRGIRATGFDEETADPTEEPALFAVGDWMQLKDMASPVRHQVFVLEQGVPQQEEWDEQDRICRHAVIRVGDSPVATGRLLPDGRIGRMAVLPEFRRRGLGRVILRSLMDEAATRGVQGLYLHAQTQALAFYEKEGFLADGEEFFECDIPHRKNDETQLVR
jgi:diadenosine tetraphosphate (Ap4A) HIT family hydrolase/predicted GNAT family N-acyltransferase